MLEDRAVPTVFAVNSLADILSPPPGVVTLRSAIQAANTTPGNNTIDLTVPGTYQITLPGASTDNTAGEFAITGTSNLTIQNTSGGHVVVDGGGLNRVFDVNPAGSTTPFTVTFQGLWITEGNASPNDGADGSGGGIRAQGGASVVLTNDVLIDNSATADGGAISLESPNNDSTGTLTVNNSQITYNHAGDAGGGIETDGTGLITVNPGSVISYNTCVNQGAGIWLDAGGASLNVTGAIISNNDAITMLAGGIGNAGAGNVNIDASLIENNFSGGTGGGFGDAANTGNLTVLNSLFLNNVSTAGGGGIQEGGPNTTIMYSNFQGNVSQDDGGALFVNGQAVSISDSHFSQNVADDGAGIEDQAGTLTLTSSTVDHNHTLATNGGTGGIGAGHDVGSGVTTVKVGISLFVANTAHNGGMASGGGINQAGGNLIVTNSQFTNNAADTGGGLSFSGSALTVNGSTFNANRSLSGGGAIAFAGTSNLQAGSTLTNDTIAFNVTGGSGGGVFHAGSGELLLLSDTINNNVATANGGGVAVTGIGLLAVEDSIIALNTAGMTGRDVFTGTGLTVTDLGGNLIGTTAGSAGFKTSTLTGNPVLGQLLDNGGQHAGVPSNSQIVQTEALLPGSPAFGKGVVTSISQAIDERGFPNSANPSIGAYQPQYAANATANQIFVENLYEVLLNRPADAGGAAAFANLLNHGYSTVNAVTLLEGSLEYHYDEVQSLYQGLFERTAGSAELQAWANFLGTGGTSLQMEGYLYTSPEFYQLHGGTTSTYVDALFEDGLGRAPSQSDVDYFGQELNTLSRNSVASQIFVSTEALTNLVNNDYLSMLSRPTESDALSAEIALLQAGVSEETLTAFILGSQESYDDRT